MKPTVNISNVYGTKSITLDQYPPEAWNFMSGDPDGAEKADVKLLSETVPWLFRGLNIIVEAISTVPICLTNGKEKKPRYLGEDLGTAFPFVDDLPILLR
jgi:hypothetical protein